MTACDSHGNTALHLASWAGSVACVVTLLHSGADPASARRSGETAWALAKLRLSKIEVPGLSRDLEPEDCNAVAAILASESQSDVHVLVHHHRRSESMDLVCESLSSKLTHRLASDSSLGSLRRLLAQRLQCSPNRVQLCLEGKPCGKDKDQAPLSKLFVREEVTVEEIWPRLMPTANILNKVKALVW